MGRAGAVAAIGGDGPRIGRGVVVGIDRGGVGEVVTVHCGGGTGAIEAVGGEAIGGQYGQGQGAEEFVFQSG